jgi:mRNA-degrading endonuclease RelE of RelBE toxin-antitoxin system
MFEIQFTPAAIEDFRPLRAYDRRRIIEAIEQQLQHQPTQETRNRKRLRPNEIAAWELRIDTFRVFYSVDETERTVRIEAIGYKRGSQLFIHGEAYEL